MLKFSGSRHQIKHSRYQRFNKPSRMFVWVEGESVFDNLRNRRNRPAKLYAELLKPVFDELGVKKVRWSQKAGCACGCSPGFVLDKRIRFDDEFGSFDVSVTISE